MKKIFYTFIIAMMSFVAVDAQDINEKEVSMSLGKQTAFILDVDGADKKLTEDVWKKFIKEYGKSKRNKKAKEYYSLGAQIPMIAGSKNIDVYVKFDERVGQTTTYMWVDTGGGFVNSDEAPKEAQGVEDFMTQFYLAVKEEAINKEMKAQEKVLNKMDKELRKLEKKNKGYHNDIEKAKKKIEDAESNIEQNLKDQEDQRIKIEQQKKVIEEVIERLNNLGKS